MCENLMLVNKSNSKCCTSYHFENFSACMVLNCNGFFYCKIHALVIYKGLLNFRYCWAKNSYKDLTGPFFFYFFHFAYRYLSVSHSHCYMCNNLLSLWIEHIDWIYVLNVRKYVDVHFSLKSVCCTKTFTTITTWNRKLKPFLTITWKCLYKNNIYVWSICNLNILVNFYRKIKSLCM